MMWPLSHVKPKERAAIISTAQAATAVFDSPALAAVTARSTFRFERLKEETRSVYRKRSGGPVWLKIPGHEVFEL